MLGPLVRYIATRPLQTNKDVLRYFFTLVKEENVLPMKSAKRVITEVQHNRKIMGKDCQPLSNISIMLLELIKEWDEVQRNRNELSEEHRLKELNFRKKLEDNFNVVKEEKRSESIMESEMLRLWFMPPPSKWQIRRQTLNTNIA